MRKLFVMLVALVSLAAVGRAQDGSNNAAPAAPATSNNGGETQWQKNHPRRAEVNQRLGNQNQRIDQGVKDGQLTQGEARQLHREDRKIRRQERRMAARHGGHITKKEKAQLNREENGVSRQIYNERHGH